MTDIGRHDEANSFFLHFGNAPKKNYTILESGQVYTLSLIICYDNDDGYVLY